MSGVRCPCCGFRTVDQSGAFEICPVCQWEDDGQGDSNLDVVRGGLNGDLSLQQARLNFAAFGACSEEALPFGR
ncbi:CPCC family cysteine-rich protein [Mesorhizobium retamae]|uniref:CPCC family cysteine-rich protein n=1 Tax=Mesorhizobium retamae TaxID=2912854 RepID=UPI0031BA6CB2